MIRFAIGFIELGGIVLAWWIFWTFLIRGCTAHHPEQCKGSPLLPSHRRHTVLAYLWLGNNRVYCLSRDGLYVLGSVHPHHRQDT